MAVEYSKMTESQISLIDEYCKNDMRELKKVCYFVWDKKGLPSCYHDDLYDDAMNVLSESAMTFDPNGESQFKTYLTNNIRRSYKDWYRDNFFRAKRNNLELDENGKIKRDKKGNPIIIHNVSFDAPAEDGIDLRERIASDFDMDDELSYNKKYGYSKKIEEFLDALSELPRKIAVMIMDGYSSSDIKDRLKLSDKEYKDCWEIICSYEKKRVLYEEKNNVEDEEMNGTFLTEDVAESYKNTSYSIDSISKQLQKKRIRDDHILQRHSGQWKKFAKSELISDILRGKSLTQIIISEEIKNKLRMQWLIDGKQRCTTLDDYLHDGFAISKNVKNYIIRYQTVKVDEDGNEVLNEDGFTEMEFKEFDIRGKKFSQLPEELQDIYRDRQIPVLYNMNCTKKDIADDIARFNRSRPMNKAQNGWLGLEEEFAEFVENIAKMQFFQPDFLGSSYTNNNHVSGLIRRIIVESIMVSDFIDDYCKDFNKMCEFLSEEASDSNFTEFYSLIERLTAIADESISKLFCAKDSFLWFGLFSRFTTYGLDDERYIDFLHEFNNNLHNKKINEVSFDEIGNGSTKDKNVVIEKMNHLETLMKEYLHIKDEETITTEDFISEVVDMPVETVKEEIEVYEEDLKMYQDNLIKDGSKLLEVTNHLSLLAMVAYAYKNDITLDDWLEEYAENNNTYNVNQRQNFIQMVNDLKQYQNRIGVA